MPHSLLHNTGVMPAEVAIVRPAPLETSPCRFALPKKLATSPAALRKALGVKDLRALIEKETQRLGLHGCALVRAPRAKEIAGSADLLLSLVVLSKSSERIFLPAKTPLLDAQTLSRKLVSADPRLRRTP